MPSKKTGTAIAGLIHDRLKRSVERVFVHSAHVARDPDARRMLREACSAYRDHRLANALRIVDRAWRHHADDAAQIAPLYGRLLLLEAREYDAALSMLERGQTWIPGPDDAALAAFALLQMRRPEEAQQMLDAALAAFCVGFDDLLALMAAEVASHAAVATSGWIGRGAHLELLGVVLKPADPCRLEIRAGAGSPIVHSLRAAAGAPYCTFSLPQTDAGPGLRLEARIDGRALLGSGHSLAPDFGLDGRTTAEGGAVSGWARLGWAPGTFVTIRLEDSVGHGAQLIARRPSPSGRWGFSGSLRALGLRGGVIAVSAQLPDGRWEKLPDTPLLLESAVRRPKSQPPVLPLWGIRSSRTRKQAARRARAIDVIVPIYRGLAESLACIDSVVATCKGLATLVVVDDATEEPGLAAALQGRAKKGQFILLRNRTNLGFVASVNRALILHPTRDAVLLNADTRVFGNWLQRLREAAYSRSDIGTVTPLSNNATIASYPQPLGGSIDLPRAAALDSLAAATPGAGADIPVGVGSCLYLRRDCLTDVGNFDADVFGKGYGEETDFCLRARQRGWTHRLAADVYVYHAGGTSFGSRREALLERSRRLLNLRHPGYDRCIGSFLKRDPLQPLRRTLDAQRLQALEGPLVLIVTLALPGGVDRYVAERSAQLRAAGLTPLVLRPAATGGRSRCELSSETLQLPNLQYSLPRELKELMGLLQALPLKAIELQHFLGLDARLIEAIRTLPVPYHVMVHDYAWICPRVTLIDGSGRYCGEPTVKRCEVCVRKHGSSLEENITVTALRARSAEWLKGARRVLTPSADAAARLRRHFPDVAVTVQPHGLPYSAVPRHTSPEAGARLRVALLGAVGPHKGYDVLLACARNAKARKLPLEFVVIGFTSNDAALLATGHAFVTGRYQDHEVEHLLEREQPHLGWIPSVWPETWCYTVDHLLRTGLPLVAFDIGAVAERLRPVAGSVMLPLGLEPARINDRLLQLVQQRPVAERIF